MSFAPRAGIAAPVDGSSFIEIVPPVKRRAIMVEKSFHM